MQHFFCPFEVKLDNAGDDGTIPGYGSVFGNVDFYGDTVAKARLGSPLPTRNQVLAVGPRCFCSTATKRRKGKRLLEFGPICRKTSAA